MPDGSKSKAAERFHRLRDRGYVEGRDVVLERRATEGHPERLPAFMEELVTLRVDVIVTAGPGVQAAASATDTIPIVANVDDPVALGMTATLARPNRNVTGVTDTPDLSIHSKRLQLLKEVAPNAKRVAVLDFKYVDSVITPGTHARRREIETTARQLGMTLIAAGADNVDELDRALSVSVTEHADALIDMGDPVTLAGRRTFVEFAARIAESVACRLRVTRIRGRWGIAVLWREHSGDLWADGRIRRQDSQGCKGHRPALRTSNCL